MTRKPRSVRRPRASAALTASTAFVAIAVSITGCSGDDPKPTTLAATATATAADSPTAAISGFFTVDDHKLFLSCTPGASPAVVYLHDLGRTSEDAAYVGNRVPGGLRYCSYDRSGTGVSGVAAHRTSGADAVSDLHGLLAAAKIDTPVVLVGEGWGGLLAAMYAASNPDDIAGLVLSDPTLPGDWRLLRYLPADDAASFSRSWEANGEQANVQVTLKLADHALERMPDIPVRVLQSADIEEPASWDWEKILAAHAVDLEAFVGRLPHAAVVESDAKAPLTYEAPDEVAKALSAVLDQVG